MSSINNNNFEENMDVEHVLTVTSPTVDPTILNAKESVERQISMLTEKESMLSKVYTSTLDPTEMEQAAKALDQCNKSRQERCKELFELNALINGPSQIRAVVSEAAFSSASVSNASSQREDTSLNPNSLPRLQWRNADGTDVIVDPKREIFQSAAEAIQVLGWQFFPPGNNPENSTVDWRKLVQRVMNGEQLMWYRKTFLKNHPDLSSVTSKMFSDEFLARHGSQSAFMYEPLKKLLEFTHIHMNPTRETIDAYLLRFNQERLLADLPDDATTAHLLLQGLTNTLKTRAMKVLALKADDSYLTTCRKAEEIALLSYRLEFPTGVSSFVDTRSPSYTPTCITVDDMELVEAPIVKKKGKNAAPAWQEFSRDNDDGRTPPLHRNRAGPNLHHRASGNMIGETNYHNNNSNNRNHNYQQGNFNNQQVLQKLQELLVSAYTPCDSHGTATVGHNKSNCSVDRQNRNQPVNAASVNGWNGVPPFTAPQFTTAQKFGSITKIWVYNQTFWFMEPKIWGRLGVKPKSFFFFKMPSTTHQHLVFFDTAETELSSVTNTI